MNRLFVAIALASSCGFAHAHITLEQTEAAAGSYYKAVFRVPHGCEGSPTRAVTVFLPPDVVGAKPMPKPGWKLQSKSEKLAKPYESHGRTIGERTAVIAWSGGRLLDSEYDEFVVRVSLPAQPGIVRFRVLQDCERGSIDWSETPAEGKPAARFPAPALHIAPATSTEHKH
jgi:periplasmic copper chaperone A